MRSASILAVATTAAAQYKGFNYGSQAPDGSAATQQDFEDMFNRAANLPGQSGFTSARLYTMIQYGTTNDLISAVPAAIATKTSLLLGLWASAGQTQIDNEIAALNYAIKQYGSSFTNLIAGISVGSEDLYRVSPTGIMNKSGAGATPDEIVSYINQVRANISSTAASGAKVGHVDTWTAWVNGSNSAVNNAVDWLGVDSYPYYQTTDDNSIDNGANLFFQSVHATEGVSNGKPVWVTESGWPTSGPTSGQAVASTQNAEKYWQAVACPLLGQTNTWWFDLEDAGDNSGVNFGLLGNSLNNQPLYDLSCSASSKSSNSTNSAAGGYSSGTASAGSSSSASASSSAHGAKSTGASSANGTASAPAYASGSGSSSGNASASATGYGVFPSASGSSGSYGSAGSAGASSAAGSSAGSSAAGGNAGSSPSTTGSSAPHYTGAASSLQSFGLQSALLAVLPAVFFL